MKQSIVKPYIQFIGNNATAVTGSCTILRFDNIKLAIDMGLIQTNNIVADYRANREQMKKIKPKTLHGVYCTHIHSDHVSGLLIAVHQGMQAHIYIPQGSLDLLRIMLEDSAKIMEQDSLKLQSKHGIKAPPLATQDDVDKVIQRCIEIPFNKPTEIVGGAMITLYPAGHIVCSSQAVIELKQGYVIKRIGITGDFSTEVKGKSVEPIKPLPRCQYVIGEATYSDPTRCYSMKKDRWYDEEMIKTAVEQYNKILIPVFALQRVEDVLEELKKLDLGVPIYLDSPLACRIYNHWVEPLDYESTLGLKLITDWEESKSVQFSHEHCIILSPSGMLSAGRALQHLKTVLPDSRNCVLFVGYSAENTLATEIKQGAKTLKIDGEIVENRAQIYSLNSFSSHANYVQLMQYYQTIDYDKLFLVHSNFDSKVAFAHTLQDKLIEQGKSSKVIAVNEDTKIYI